MIILAVLFIKNNSEKHLNSLNWGQKCSIVLANLWPFSSFEVANFGQFLQILWPISHFHVWQPWSRHSILSYLIIDKKQLKILFYFSKRCSFLMLQRSVGECSSFLELSNDVKKKGLQNRIRNFRFLVKVIGAFYLLIANFFAT